MRRHYEPECGNGRLSPMLSMPNAGTTTTNRIRKPGASALRPIEIGNLERSKMSRNSITLRNTGRRAQVTFGLTLIELLVVIAISALLAALLLPALKPVPTLEAYRNFPSS
jgi:prepilin-type N-terminal cleavage/methylation domain-containing protein